VEFTEGSRWYRRLALAAEYEIWLLTWLPGQHTGFHDHGHSCGAFAVAHGELLETLATPGSSRLWHRVATRAAVTPFGGSRLHDVGCNTAEPAISVHAYSPPLSAMRRYKMTAAGLMLVATERAGREW
jgi:hypothetical protein